jgi:hypothetical protein
MVGYRSVPYTIEIDWENKVVMLNNRVSKEKLIITKKDSRSTSDCFELMKIKPNRED